MTRAVAVLVALALTLAACGAEDDADPGAAGAERPRLGKRAYESEVKAAFAEATRINERAEQRGASAQFDAVVPSLTGVVERLSAVRPPAEVARAHADYVGGLRGLRDALVPLVEAVRRGDERAAEDLSSAVPPDARQRILSARQTFDRLGYDLGTDPVGA